MIDTVEGMSVLADDDDNQKSAAANGIELPQGYVPSEDEPFMNPLQLAYFRKKLLDWKDDIHREAKETLAQLQALRDKGLLTPEEFEAKKTAALETLDI